MSFTPFQINSVGGIPTPPTAVPASIADGATYDSGVMQGGGYNKLAVAANVSHAGTLTLSRYIDLAGTIKITTDVTQAVTANTEATIYLNDGVACATWRVTLANSAGAASTVAHIVFMVAT